MKRKTLWWLGLTAVVAVTFGLAGCTGGSESHEGESSERGHAEEAGEHAAAESAGEHAMAQGEGEHASAEGEGEHGEAREGRGEHGGEHAESGEHSGEHGGEHGEAGHDEEGEESGVYIGRGETWDVVRRGARLVLAFDAESNAFVGAVENTTSQTLCAIRVEVHLSTGTELGPTPRNDLPVGQTVDVRLPTEGEAFDTWTAHPEMSACSGG